MRLMRDQGHGPVAHAAVSRERGTVCPSLRWRLRGGLRRRLRTRLGEAQPRPERLQCDIRRDEFGDAGGGTEIPRAPGRWIRERKDKGTRIDGEPPLAKPI